MCGFSLAISYAQLTEVHVCKTGPKFLPNILVRRAWSLLAGSRERQRLRGSAAWLRAACASGKPARASPSGAPPCASAGSRAPRRQPCSATPSSSPSTRLCVRHVATTAAGRAACTAADCVESPLGTAVAACRMHKSGAQAVTMGAALQVSAGLFILSLLEVSVAMRQTCSLVPMVK